MIVVAADGGLLVPSLLRFFALVPFALPSTRVCASPEEEDWVVGFSGPGATCCGRLRRLFLE